MLLPADLLSSTLMPWAMAATALPLLFMLSGRITFSGLNISILLACIVSMLTNMFYGILPRNPVNVRNVIHLAGILLECGVTFMLIWNLTTERILRRIILAAAAVTAVTLIFSFFGAESGSLKTKHVLALSYLGLATLAAAAILQQAASDMEGFITRHPSFWTGAGIIFYHGLMALLLLLLPSGSVKEWASLAGFGIFFTIAHSIRYLLFATAVHIGGKQNTVPEV